MNGSSRSRLAVGAAAYVAACAAVVAVMVLVPDNRPVRVVLAVLAFLVMVGFMGTYHLGTNGFWRRSDIGVHLMTAALANAVVLLYVVFALLGWIPLVALPFLSALTYLTLSWLYGWRTVVMRRYLRGGK